MTEIAQKAYKELEANENNGVVDFGLDFDGNEEMKDGDKEDADKNNSGELLPEWWHDNKQIPNPNNLQRP